SELFSGAFWTGSRALQLGLIDGLGELTDVMQQRFGHDVKFKPVEQQQSWLKQKLGISSSSSKFKSNENMIFSIINNVLLSIEERSFWSKFGL
ncbi:S49 family peptidase, partial [Rhodospirillales bacterium]|nr:S49 family peptidase [Rhodospirillales bacterium]